MGVCGRQPTLRLAVANDSQSMTQDLLHCVLQPGLVYKHCHSVTPLTGEKAEP